MNTAIKTSRGFRFLVLICTGLLCILLSGAGRYTAEPEDSQESVVQEPLLLVYPLDPAPGDPVTIALTIPSDTLYEQAQPRAVLLSESGRRLVAVPLLRFTADEQDNPVKVGLLAVPVMMESGPVQLLIEGINGYSEKKELYVQHKDFISEEIVLDQANTDIRSTPDPQKTAESRELWETLHTVSPFFYDGSAFVPPTDATRRTSFFGDRRVFVYSHGGRDTSIHAGIDYGIATGTPVYACAAGRVVMSKFRIVTGNTVIIEHLPGVYSLYYHLDSLELEVNRKVSAGTLIGKSGSTGLSTGPHLHWEIRVHGEMADPDSFVRRAVLDKDEILSKMGELVREKQN